MAKGNYGDWFKDAAYSTGNYVEATQPSNNNKGTFATLWDNIAGGAEGVAGGLLDWTGSQLNALDEAGRKSSYVDSIRNSDSGSLGNAGNWLINNGEYLNNKAAENFAESGTLDKYNNMSLLERALSLDYLTDRRGLLADAGQMVGSAIPFAVASAVAPFGGAGAAAARATGSLAGRIGFNRIGTAIASKAGQSAGAAAAKWGLGTGPLEAAVNAGGIYQDLKEQGLSDEEIARRMNSMIQDELPMDIVTQGIVGPILEGKGFRPIFKRGGKLGSAASYGTNVIGSSLSEYKQEQTQQAVQNKWSGKPYGTFFNPTEDEEQAGRAAFFGSLPLGIFGAGHTAYRDYKRRIARNQSNADPFRNQPEVIGDEATYVANNNGVVGSGAANDKESFFNAVEAQESGGNPNAVSSAGARGVYQIMPDNWDAWSREAGLEGADMNDDEAYRQVGRFKMGQYYDQYGPEGALVAWYSGPNNAARWGAGETTDQNGKPWDAPQSNGPSIAEYVNSTMSQFQPQQQTPAFAIPETAEYNVSSEVSNPNLTDLTEQKLRWLDNQYYQQYGRHFYITSMARNGNGESWHDSAQAFDTADDFLEGNSEARDWLINKAKEIGLYGLDEYSNPSAHATGGHLHFSDHGEAISGNVQASGGTRQIDMSQYQLTPEQEQQNLESAQALIDSNKVSPEQAQAVMAMAEDLMNTPYSDNVDEDVAHADAIQDAIDNGDVKAIFDLHPQETANAMFAGKKPQPRQAPATPNIPINNSAVQQANAQQQTQSQAPTNNFAQVVNEITNLAAQGKIAEAAEVARNNGLKNTMTNLLAHATTQSTGDIQSAIMNGVKLDMPTAVQASGGLAENIQSNQQKLSFSQQLANIANNNPQYAAALVEQSNLPMTANAITQAVANGQPVDSNLLDNAIQQDLDNRRVQANRARQVTEARMQNAGLVVPNTTPNAGIIVPNGAVENTPSIIIPSTSQRKGATVNTNDPMARLTDSPIYRQAKANGDIAAMANEADAMGFHKEAEQIRANNYSNVPTKFDFNKRLSEVEKMSREDRRALGRERIEEMEAKNIPIKDNLRQDLENGVPKAIVSAEKKIAKADDETAQTKQTESNKKAANEGGYELADGYKTESGKPLSEADKNEFIVKPDGSKDFGEISQNISKAVKEQSGIDLKPGKIRLRVGDESQGLIHAKKHEQQAKDDGYNSIEEMIADVASDFDEIYMRDPNTENGNPTYSLIKRGDKAKGKMNGIEPVYFEMQGDGKGNYYIVLSVMPMGDKNLKRNIIKTDHLIYSSPGLGAATVSNVSAVSRVSHNVGADTHGGYPTSDKSSSLVNSSVAQDKKSDNNKEDLTGKKIVGKSGKTATVITDSGKELNVTYKLVPASRVVTSHTADGLSVNKKYPQELQPRDRQRVAMRQQITKMANELRPEDLAEGRNLNQGAPIVREDGVVLNGNGRAIAIQTAQNGKKESAKKYKMYLVEHAEEFGFKPEDVKGMKAPMLVRMVENSDESATQDIINSTTGGSRLGASEQAKVDAKKIGLVELEAYVPNDKGDLTTAANRDFLQGIMNKIIGNDDMNAYLDEHGNINADGIQRIKRALFQAAYGNDELIAKMAESTDDAIKNVTNALTNVAPVIARVNAKMEHGEAHKHDLAKNIADAVNRYNHLRQTGEPLEHYLSQQSMFSEYVDTPEVIDILKALDKYKRSANKLSQFFSRVGEIIEAQGNPKEESLFESVQPLNLKQIINTAYNEVENGGKGKNLFDMEPAEQSESNKKAADEGGTVEVTGDEFGEYSTIDELRDKAKAYYKEHLQGTSVNNPILGKVNLAEDKVDFTGRGIKKAISTSGKKNKLLLIKHLPNLIRNATEVDAKENVKNKREAKQYTYLHTEAVIDGKTEPVTITIFTDVNGNRYYNHILENEEHTKKELPVYPAQASKEGDGIPTMQQLSNESVSQDKKSDNTKGEADSPFGRLEDAKREMEEALGIRPLETNATKADDEAKISRNKFAGVDTSAEAEEAIKAELKAALKKSSNRLNAMPMFDPDIIIPAMKLGRLYVARGAEHFTEYAREMIDAVGDNVREWLHPVWSMLQNYRESKNYNEAQILPVFKYVGAIMQNNQHATFEDVRKSFAEEYGEAAADKFNDILEIGHIGADTFYNNNEEVTDSELYDSTGESAKRNSEGNNQNQVGAVHEVEESRAERGSSVQSTSKEVRAQRSGSVYGRSADSSREISNSRVQGEQSEQSTRDDSTGNKQLAGSRRDSFDRPAVDDGRNAKGLKSVTARPNNETAVSNKPKATKIKPSEFKSGNREQIENTMPFLMKGQVDDIIKADNRLFEQDGKGMMFTNGTGTGKTFTGLGVISRMVQQGKKNILILAPTDKVQNDWITAGKGFFGLKISKLKSTKDAGEGIVISSYENVGDNNALFGREWDLIVTDESHKLMQSAQGNETNALKKVRGLTHHERGFYDYFYGTNPEIVQKMNDLRHDDSGKYSEAEQKAIRKEYDEAQERAKQEWNKYREKPNEGKVLFLSATPFSYVSNIDYAEGYLFDYPKADNRGGYNQPSSGREQFLIDHFGYRMRYNKLNKPDAEVNQDLMEIRFNSWLKEQGVLSGRKLEVGPDYERGYILVDSGVGKKIDEGMDIALGYNKEKGDKYPLLHGAFRNKLKGNNSKYLLEAVKAKESIELIKEYLKTGKKIVVFHDFKKNEAQNPFILTDSDFASSTLTPAELANVRKQYEQFCKDNPDLINLNFGELMSPIERFKQEFGDKVRIFNGEVPKAKREQAVREFNDDDSKVQIILCQRAAAKEGISLHDTTGKHQRVLIDLGLPTRPTDLIQCEGRIYRTGVATNAIIRYLNTGMSLEKNAFANTMAGRSASAENLSMGEEARALRDAIVNGYMETVNSNEWQRYLPNTPTEGTGGKERDGKLSKGVDDFDAAVSDYYSNQKKTSKNKAQEGIDYYPTPEPVGFKMVDWLGLKAGNKVLEPSAGHGAISRYFSANTRNTIIEPSEKLSTLAKMRLRGGTTANVISGYFEDFHIGNKFDGIAMNPPYGTGGKTAMEHLAKAFKHLYDGGRVIAIVPDGTSFNKRFDNWYYGDGDKVAGQKSAIVRAEIKLPQVTFKRAGTSVATKIVVIDKYENAEDMDVANAQGTRNIDLSGITDVKELFDEIKTISMPERVGADIVNNFSNTTDKNNSYAPHVALLKNVDMLRDRNLRLLANKYNGEVNKSFGGYAFTTDGNRGKFVREANRYLAGKTVDIQEQNNQSNAVTDDTATIDSDVAANTTEHFEVSEYTRTDSGEKRIAVKPHDYATGMNRVIKGLARKYRGGFSRYNGLNSFLFKADANWKGFLQEAEAVLSGDSQTHYSATEAREKKAQAIEKLRNDIAEALPNAKNIRDEGSSVYFTMPNGAEVEIHIADSLNVTGAAANQARQAHGINDGVSIKINGMERTIGSKAIIQLSKIGDEGSVHHEVFHAVWDMVLTPKEKKAITKAYEVEAKRKGKDVVEVAADKYRDWFMAKTKGETKDANGKPFKFGLLWRKFREVVDKLRSIIAGSEEVNRTFREIENGKVWERPLDNQKAETDNVISKMFDEVRAVVDSDRHLYDDEIDRLFLDSDTVREVLNDFYFESIQGNEAEAVRLSRLFNDLGEAFENDSTIQSRRDANVPVRQGSNNRTGTEKTPGNEQGRSGENSGDVTQQRMGATEKNPFSRKTVFDVNDIRLIHEYEYRNGSRSSTSGFYSANNLFSLQDLTERDNEYLSLVDEYNNATTDEAKAAAHEKLTKMVQQAAEDAGCVNAVPEQTRAYTTRTKKPPTKTKKVYKVFTVDESGRPSALFVSSKDTLPQNVWLDANDTFAFTDSKNGRKYIPSTKNPNTKGGATGESHKTENISDEELAKLEELGYIKRNKQGQYPKTITGLAYRPGWHAGDLPFFPQGGKQGDGTTNYKNIHRYNQVVFECEIAYDTDYTKSGTNSKGQIVYTDMQEMPVNGGYKFATNPMTSQNDLGSWYISGSVKIGRALTEEECNKILAKNGFKPQEWQEYGAGNDFVIGKLDLAKLGYTGEEFDAARKTLAPITYDDEGNVIPLSQRFNPEIDDIRFSVSEMQTDSEPAGSLDRMRRAINNLAGVKTESNVEVREGKRGNANDNMNMLDMWAKSVRQVARKSPVVKQFYKAARKAYSEQERLRSHFGEAMKRFNTYVKNKKDLADVAKVLWSGDMEGKYYSVKELKEAGLSDNGIRAYKLARERLEEAYNLINDARMQVRTRSKLIPATSIDEFMKSHFLTQNDIVDTRKRGNSLLVTYKGAKVTEHTEDMTKEAFANLQSEGEDGNVYIYDTEEFTASDGTDMVAVHYSERIKPVSHLKGYMPHFFHKFMVYQKVTDSDGNTHNVTIGSGRSLKEAADIANKVAKENPNNEYLISPHGFEDSEEYNNVVVGDRDFAKMTSQITKHTEMSLADANKFLHDTAGVSLKGRHRYLGNLLQRTGAEGFEQDVQWALEHYFNVSARYVAMEHWKPNAISMYERYFGAFDAEPKTDTARYVKNHINDMNGVPSRFEQLLNRSLENTALGKRLSDYYNGRPALALSGSISSFTAITKLGLGNFASAAVNFMQFINVATGLNSYKWAMQGLQRALKPTEMDRKIIEASGIMDEISMADNNGGYSKNRDSGRVRGVIGTIKRLGEKSMMPFTWADTLMRKAAILGGYYQGVAEKDMKPMSGETISKRALNYAKEINLDANFDYSTVATPGAMRAGSVLTQQLFQFQKYPIMQFEFMWNNVVHAKNNAQRARFLVPYLLLAGMCGSIPFGDLLNGFFSFLAGLFTGKDVNLGEACRAEMMKWAGNDESSRKLVNFVQYGVPGLFNVDISSRVGMAGAFSGKFYGNTPESTGGVIASALGGPLLSTIVNTSTQLQQGNPVEAIKAISPALGNMLQAAYGETHTTGHRVATVYEDGWSRFMHGLGFRSADESNTAFINNQLYNLRQSTGDKKKDAMNAYRENKTAENKRAMEELGITKKQYDKYEREAEMSSKERALQESKSKKKKKVETENTREASALKDFMR